MIELVKYHFRDEISEIEHISNEEYQKQREVIQQQIDKICANNEGLKAVDRHE